MGNGTQNSAVVDLLITNALIGYQPKGFVADQVFPLVKHAQYTGKIGKLDSDYLRIITDNTGGKAEFRRVDIAVRSSVGFDIDGHGLADVITKKDRANASVPFDSERETAEGLVFLSMLQQEYAMAQSLGDSAVLTKGVTLAGQQQFNDYANSDPLDKFNTGRLAVKDNCGEEPDTAIIPWHVMLKLRYHPQLLAQLGYTYKRPGGLTVTEIASVLEVGRVLVPAASYNTAKKGQTKSLGAVWGKHIILGVLPAAPGKYQVSGGYVVRPNNGAAHKIYKTPLDSPPDATLIQCENEYDQIITDVNAMYLIKNAVA